MQALPGPGGVPVPQPPPTGHPAPKPTSWGNRMPHRTLRSYRQRGPLARWIGRGRLSAARTCAHSKAAQNRTVRYHARPGSEYHLITDAHGIRWWTARAAHTREPRTRPHNDHPETSHDVTHRHAQDQDQLPDQLPSRLGQVRVYSPVRDRVSDGLGWGLWVWHPSSQVRTVVRLMFTLGSWLRTWNHRVTVSALRQKVSVTRVGHCRRVKGSHHRRVHPHRLQCPWRSIGWASSSDCANARPRSTSTMNGSS